MAMFVWTSISAGLDGELVSLKHRSTEIARLWMRLDGQWFADLDRHLPSGCWRTRTRSCSSLEAGRAGCLMWAQRHQARIAKEVDEQLQEWQARQTWLGPRRAPH